MESAGQAPYEGPCLFRPGKGGSFSIRAANGEPIAGRKVISVTLTDRSTAEVTGLTQTGNVSRWGQAMRSDQDKACWKGQDFRICAY